MLDRRSLVAGALLAPVLPNRPAIAAAAVQEFTAFRNGSPLGRLLLTFTPDGARLRVDIRIELDVKLAFIPLYRYRHTNRELWENGRLVSFASSTDDNGKTYRVEAQREGDMILVEGEAGRVEAPGDAMPSTYWHRRFLEAPVWIDTQAGRLLDCTVTRTGAEPVLAAGREVPADRFAVTFTTGRISVTADCNTCSGSATLQDSTLTIGALACTRAACASAPLDTRFTALLEGRLAVHVNSRILRLNPPQGVGELHFER